MFCCWHNERKDCKLFFLLFSFIQFVEVKLLQLSFIRVRIRFVTTDTFRFSRRIRFRPGETAMLRFKYERLRGICSSCFRITHHTNHCPILQRLPENSVDLVVSERIGQIRVGLNDELHRAWTWSLRFLIDISQLPRPETPPLNTEEIAAASPYFHPSKMENVQHFVVSIQQNA